MIKTVACVGIPARYNQKFETLEKKGYWFKAWEKLKEKILFGGLMIICGSHGVGKTMLLCQLCRYCSLKLKKHSRYENSLDFFNAIRGGYDGSKLIGEEARINFYADYQLLALDALENSRMTDWETAELARIINRRYSERLDTVLATNWKPEEMRKVLGMSILDRAMEKSGELIIFNEKSMRGEF